MSSYEGQALVLAVEEALISRVKASLKAPLMIIAEKEIDDTIDEAIKALNMSFNAYKDVQWNRTIVDVLVTRSQNTGNSDAK